MKTSFWDKVLMFLYVLIALAFSVCMALRAFGVDLLGAMFAGLEHAAGRFLAVIIGLGLTAIEMCIRDRAVHQRVLAVELDLPVAVFQTGQGVAFAVPVVEIADQVHLVRARRPLAVHPAVFRAGDAVVEVAVGERRKVCLVAKQGAARVRVALHAQGDIAVIWLQPRVDGQDLVLRLLRGAAFHGSSSAILYTSIIRAQ